MTNSATSLDLFRSALLEASKTNKRTHARWKRIDASSENVSVCPLCKSKLTARKKGNAYLTHLVPLELGGLDTLENRIVACRRCTKAKANGDVVDASFLSTLSTPLTANLLEKRLEILRASHNHLTSLSPWVTREKLHDHLKVRHTHARVKLFAHVFSDVSVIGWVKPHGTKSALGIAELIIRAGGVSDQSDDDLSLFVVPHSNTYNLLWSLIEWNVWVCSLSSLGAQHVIDERDWRQEWPRSYINTRDNLRRFMRGEDKARWPERKKSMSHSAVSQRQKNGVLRRKHEVERGLALREKVNAWMHEPTERRPSVEHIQECYLQYNWLLMTVEDRREFNQKHKTKYKLHP